MSTRDEILSAIATNQPAYQELPQISFAVEDEGKQVEKFTSVLTAIGGRVVSPSSYDDVLAYIKNTITTDQRVLSTITQLLEIAEEHDAAALPHSLQNIELAVIKAHFGVAENGAVWITEDLLNQRVLPFICQNLIVILNTTDIVANMHRAYEKIGTGAYGFGTFIAGPSKTADIEQSLVLGAHGSRSMTVFLINADQI